MVSVNPAPTGLGLRAQPLRSLAVSRRGRCLLITTLRICQPHCRTRGGVGLHPVMFLLDLEVALLTGCSVQGGNKLLRRPLANHSPAPKAAPYQGLENGSVPSPHIRQLRAPCHSSSWGFNTFFWFHRHLHTHGAHTQVAHTQVAHTCAI